MIDTDKIILRKNPFGDTRTAPKDTDFDSFSEATDWHRNEVKNVMMRLGYLAALAGEKHDWTKKTYEDEFFKDFVDGLNGKIEFVDGTWWPKHISMERHHLNSKVPDDVNLIDVLEMVVDCTCAGLTRSGKVRPVEIDAKVLEKAVTNTVELIKDITEVVD